MCARRLLQFKLSNHENVPRSVHHSKPQMRILIFLIFCLASGGANAVDGASFVTQQEKIFDWLVLEFTMPKGILYRIASDDNKNYNLTIDFTIPKCEPSAVVLVKKLKSNKKSFKNNNFILAYKLPGQEAQKEIVSIEITKNDNYAFFEFNELNPDMLMNAHTSEKLLIWLLESVDGTNKSNSYMRISLKGFESVYKKAKKACELSR